MHANYEILIASYFYFITYSNLQQIRKKCKFTLQMAKKWKCLYEPVADYHSHIYPFS